MREYRILVTFMSKGAFVGMWIGQNVLRAKGKREYSGEIQEEPTDEERKEAGQNRRNRRLRKTIRGKNTYQPRN